MKKQNEYGIIYVLSNNAFPDVDGKKILKIGRTTNLLHRIRVLNIGVPDDYKVEYALRLAADQYILAETLLHQLFKDKNEKREFYRLDLKAAINKMEQMCKLTKGTNITQDYQNEKITIKSHITRKDKTIFTCQSKGANAHGFYDDVKKCFVVLKGSIIGQKTVPSFKNAEERTKKIIVSCKEINGQLELQKNLTFATPSGASCFCFGRPSNGWLEWKDVTGKPLSEFYKH